MQKEQIKIEEKRDELLSIYNTEKHFILATCADDRVTVRPMSYINFGLDLVFGTDQNFLKFEQIKKNPKVAYCLKNIQVEGVAEILGHPSEPQNAEISVRYKEKQPKSFELYWAGKTQIVIKIHPTLFTQWKYIDGKPCREFYDVKKNESWREYVKCSIQAEVVVG